MIKCRSPRSLVLGIRNLLWFLVRSEYEAFLSTAYHTNTNTTHSIDAACFRKARQQTRGGNSVNPRPILNFSSLSESSVNLQRRVYETSHRTSHASPHYFVKH